MELDNDVFKDVLGIAITSQDKLPYILSSIPVEQFPIGELQTIYKVVKLLYDVGCSIDMVTVSNRLAEQGKLKEVGGRTTINSIALEAPLPHLCGSIIKSALKQIQYRNILALTEEFSQAIRSSNEIDTLSINYCSTLSSIISDNNTNDKLEQISSGANDVIEQIEYARTNGNLGLKTGFVDIDYALGGLQKGKLYVVGGRPSMGKSAYAMNIAEYIAKEKNVLFVSLEMSNSEYAQRLMLGRAGVYSDKINTGRVTDSDMGKIIEQKKYLESLNLFIRDKSPCKISHIELDIINIIASRKSCDLVVIDYLQLLTPTNRSRSRENEVAEMTMELKCLARKYGVPIILLSQLSRALEIRDDKRPMLSDLRESGAIEQDADVVMFVYRDEWYHPEDGASRGKGEILIRKNRGGRNNINVELCWKGNETRFSNPIKV